MNLVIDLEDDHEVVLIANRGEIAIRIARAPRNSGSNGRHLSEDDAASLHTRRADGPALGGGGDGLSRRRADRRAGKATEVDAVHPGYGFLSENAGFARACARSRPDLRRAAPEALELFGDKARGAGAGQRCGVPILARHATADDAGAGARRSWRSSAPARDDAQGGGGGGGRGMRPGAARRNRGRLRALPLGGEGRVRRWHVYVERTSATPATSRSRSSAIARAASHLGERECTVQRRHQKMIEIAPAPSLSAEVRAALLDAAVDHGARAGYDRLGDVRIPGSTAERRGAIRLHREPIRGCRSSTP